MKWLTKKMLWVIGAVVAFILVLDGFLIAYRAPSTFPDSAVVSISAGESLSEIADTLKSEHIIRSTFLFTNFVILLKHESSVVSGDYYFDRPISVMNVARRMSHGEYNIDQMKTTIPEGSTIFDISMILKRRYPNFDPIHFVTIAQGKEGYLFPDTYYFGANVSPEKVLSIMTSTFDKKIQQPDIAEAIKNSGHSQKDIITMASLLEGEARQFKTRQIVAGILWRRIELGIPLQVDAAFRYVNGKTTEQLTLNDLKIDSPYNTYLYKGLTPTPISNPGLDAILAAATPEKTQYLYFLTDKEGTMHYATTLEEHARNKKKYLGK